MHSIASPEVDGVVQQSFYVIFGVIGAASNAVVVVTILLNRHLYRKPYGLIAALAIADTLTDAGLFCLGVNRLRILVSRGATEALTNWRCLTKAPVLLSVVGPQSAVLITLVSSVDRLLAAIVSTSRYDGYGKRYAFLVFCCFGVGFGSCAWSFYAVHAAGRRDFPLAALCSFSETFTPETLLLYFATQTAAGWASAIIILVTLLAFAKPDPPAAGSDAARSRRNEITHSVAVSVAASFVLWFTPATVLAFGYATGADGANLSAFTPYVWMLIELRSTLSMFIYFWRDKALRDGALTRLCREPVAGIRTRWSSRGGRGENKRSRYRYRVTRALSDQTGAKRAVARAAADALDDSL